MANTAKENILKKIRQALVNPVPVPFPSGEGNESPFQPAGQEPEIEFAENFSKLQGRFSFCFDEKELVSQLAALIKTRKWESVFCAESNLAKKLQDNGLALAAKSVADCDASVTGCEVLVARTGSILLSSAQQKGRTTSVYAPVHICIAYTDQLVYDVKAGLQFMKEKYGNSLPSLITLATGPSRTADIEKTLVVGVHGPKEVFCFLVDRS